MSFYWRQDYSVYGFERNPLAGSSRFDMSMEEGKSKKLNVIKGGIFPMPPGNTFD